MAFKRITIALDEELLNDIFFDVMKVHGKIEPEKSVGAYIGRKIRPLVPHRNAQVAGNIQQDNVHAADS